MKIEERNLRGLISNWSMPEGLTDETFLNGELAKYIGGRDKKVGLPDIEKVIEGVYYGIEAKRYLLSLSDYANLNEQLERYPSSWIKIPLIYFSARSDLKSRLESRYRTTVLVKGSTKDLKLSVVPDKSFIIGFEKLVSRNNLEFRKIRSGELYKISKTSSGSYNIKIDNPRLTFNGGVVTLPVQLWIGLDTEGFWPEILTYQVELFESVRDKIPPGWVFRHSNSEITTAIKGEKLAGITVEEAVSYYESWKREFLNLWLS